MTCNRGKHEYYRVSQSVTEYYRVLQSNAEYCTVLQSISSASTWTNFWACFDTYYEEAKMDAFE